MPIDPTRAKSPERLAGGPSPAVRPRFSPGQRTRVKLRRFWRSARSLVFLVVGFTALRSSVADWNDVPTGSMKPTILEGDRIYVNKLAYDLKVPYTTIHLATWGAPKRGDIVVFYSPEDGIRLVKRCVGLPGDTIELRDNRLLVNGQPCAYGTADPKFRAALDPTERQQFACETETLAGVTHAMQTRSTLTGYRYANYGPITVPAEQFFMMGDNRDNSKDSRYIGTVPRKNIVGRSSAIVLSLDINHHWTPRWGRFFSRLQ